MKNTESCEVIFDPLNPLEPLRCVNTGCKNCKKTQTTTSTTTKEIFSSFKDYQVFGVEDSEIEFFEMIMAEKMYQEKSNNILKNTMKTLKSIKTSAQPKTLMSTGKSTQSHIFNQILFETENLSAPLKPKLLRQDNNNIFNEGDTKSIIETID